MNLFGSSGKALRLPGDIKLTSSAWCEVLGIRLLDDLDEGNAGLECPSCGFRFGPGLTTAEENAFTMEQRRDGAGVVAAMRRMRW